MVVKLAAHLTNYLEKNKIIHKEKEIYTIGFSLMLNTALSYIVIILFSCKNNLLFESILFISSFGFLREILAVIMQIVTFNVLFRLFCFTFL